MSFATYLDIAAGNHTVAYLLRGGDIHKIYTQNQIKVNEMADIWRMSGQARRTCKEDDGILSI